MTSLSSSFLDAVRNLARRIDLWALRRYGRLEETRRALRKTSGRYVDPESYASMEGIPIKKAQMELEEAVQSGVMAKYYLYKSLENAVTLVLTEDDIGQEIRLADFGYLDDGDGNGTVFVSKYDVKAIYASQPAR